MELTADLDRTRSTGLIPHILEVLQKVERSIKSHKILLARYVKVADPPRLEWTDKSLMWEFEFQSTYEDDVFFNTRLELALVPGANEVTLEQALKDEVPLIKRATLQCSCFESQQEHCAHIAAMVTFLRQKIGGLDVDSAVDFLKKMMTDGRTVGQRLVESLSSLQETVVTEESIPSRLQWRISQDRHSLGYDANFGIVGYVQQLKKRGGWSKGRRIRDTFASINDDTLQHPNDRMLATLLDLSGDAAITDGLALREALVLLKNHPNVVFDDENLTPVLISEQPIELRMNEDGDLYRPELWIGGDRIDSVQSGMVIFEINAKSMLAVVMSDERHTIWFSTLNQQTFRMLKDFRIASRRKAMLDREMAEQLADIMAQPATKPVHLNLPESLAGPEQLLDPTIEIHLVPNPAMSGMEVGLRVACDATEDQPVPGTEPAKLRIATPVGRFQLVRDLPQEQINAEKIARLLPIDEWKSDGPFTWVTDSDDLALQLIESLQHLGEDGPTVCWPRKNPMRLIGEITPQRMKVQLTSQKDWFGVDGKAMLEGMDISLAEILVALRTGRRFIPLGDGQFASISDQLRQRLIAIQDVSQSESGAIRVARAATAIVEEALGEDISYESDARWQEAISRMHEVRDLNPVPPEGLKANLRDYQRHGYEWLARLSHWGLGGCLADDMGLGKTVQTLGILIDRAKAGPALIVAPTSVGTNWQRETNRFAPELNPKLYRDHDRQHIIETAGPGDLIIASYQLLQRDAERFASRPWQTLVLDEAQFIKNFQTKTARAVRNIEADWTVALSGTPLENHLGELWSLIRTVSPGLLGSWERFRKQFAEPIERGRDQDRLQALSRVVRPFILRRTKKEVLTELPPRTEVVRLAELSEEERKRYDGARLAALSELTNEKPGENEQQQRIKVLAWLTRLRQLSCHPRLVDARWTESSAKLDLFLEIVDELREGEHRALVFSQFVQHLTIVREALDKAGIHYQYLDGSTPTHKRQEAVDAFQAGEGDLFLISLKAGGTGLNLTAADYVLHLDPWWNPAVEDQATDRAHRIGQERAVTVYRLVAKDTIEEQILALHEDKRELIAGVLDGADRAGKLSTDDLVKLIRLSQVQSNG